MNTHVYIYIHMEIERQKCSISTSLFRRVLLGLEPGPAPRKADTGDAQRLPGIPERSGLSWRCFSLGAGTTDQRPRPRGS